MENGRSIEFNSHDEVVYQLVQSLESHPVELEPVPTVPPDQGGTELEFLDDIKSVYASRVFRSSFYAFPAEYDNYNRSGQTFIRFTEAKLDDESGKYLGQTVFIELKRPRGNHQLIEIFQRPHDDAELAISDEQGDYVVESPETDEIIDGICAWLSDRAEQHQVSNHVTNSLFDRLNSAQNWREELNPPDRGYKLFMTGRASSTTEAQSLQKSHYYYLQPSRDILAPPNRPNITKFRWVKETFKDGRVDISVEVLRSSGGNHLITLSQTPGDNPDIELNIFNGEGKRLEPTDELIEFMAGLEQADIDLNT